MKSNITIFITGGHVTPAVACIETLAKEVSYIRLVYVSRQVALEGTAVSAVEEGVVSTFGVRIETIRAGRFPRYLGLAAFFSFVLVPWGFVQALRLVIRHRPALILSFGGYVALPVAVVGWMLRIPVITHEQTHDIGLTNRIIGLFARRICVSFPETLIKVPATKGVYTGLPMRSIVFAPPKAPSFSIVRAPILLVTGGSTGAQSLNRLIYPIISRLCKHWMIIHQVGAYSLAEARACREGLPQALRKRYMVVDYLSGEDYSWSIHHVTLIISRSGANTVGEILALGNIAILVPLPWSAGKEQLHNAQYAETVGGVRTVPQKDLTSEQLLRRIDETMHEESFRRKKAASFASGFPHDAAGRVVDEVKNILETL